MEPFLSYFSYYMVPFMWGLFFRRWAVPLVLIALVWHHTLYRAAVYSRLPDVNFDFWMPITAGMGVTMGYLLASLMNLRRLIFWKEFDKYGCWMPYVVLQQFIMLMVFFIWELTGLFVRPINFLITFLAFVVLIPLWYFMGSGSTVWAFWDAEKNSPSYADKAAVKFHLVWGLFQLSGTLIFTVVEWSSPDVWPFWIAIGTFVFHIVLWFMLSLFIINKNSEAHEQYKKMRRELSKHLGDKLPQAIGGMFSFPWNGQQRSHDMEMEDQQQHLMEEGQVPPSQQPQTGKTKYERLDTYGKKDKP
jgi:hypothetical protein